MFKTLSLEQSWKSFNEQSFYTTFNEAMNCSLFWFTNLSSFLIKINTLSDSEKKNHLNHFLIHFLKSDEFSFYDDLKKRFSELERLDSFNLMRPDIVDDFIKQNGLF